MKHATKMRAASALALALTVPSLTGCETMKENSVATGAVGGAALGAVAGALIDGDNPGRGALIGAAAGGALGAGAGYLAKKHFERVESREMAQVKLNQQQVNDNWAKQSQAPLPAVARPELLAAESRVEPSAQLKPGQEAQFKLAFQSVGQTPYNGTLCREDTLAYKEEGKTAYEPVKEFGQKCDLATSGKNEHTVAFTIPPSAPPGNYVLSSRVYDPQQQGGLFNQDFYFNVAGATASADGEAKVLAGAR